MFEVLPGFREFYPETCFTRNFVFEKVRQVCKNFCFSEYDAPILEPIELYTEKSGEEIASQIFNFVDRGGRAVALRPEMTPSVARMIGSKINTLKSPLKWFSIEENFRYERPQKGRLRSFYQFNVDIFDEPSVFADAEIIHLVIAILTSLGLTSDDFYIRLSDRTLWSLLLQSLDIKEDSILNVLSIVDKFEKESPEIIQAKLCELHANGNALFEAIRKFQSVRDLRSLEDFFVHSSLNSEKLNARIDQFKILLRRIDQLGLLKFVTLDFSIVRGLAYYTGFVFEAFERSGESRAIAGGGRYDNLIEKFGYPATPAVGLAIGDVTLHNLLADKNLLPSFDPTCDLLVIYDESSEKFAICDIARLRSLGFSVNYTLKANMSVDKQFKQAGKARYIAYYTNASEGISIRCIAKKEEHKIPRSEIDKFLRNV